MASFYYLMRWWRGLEAQALAEALLWSAIALCFKNNGLLLIPVIGGVVLYRWYIERFPLRTLWTRRILIAAAAVVIAGTFTFGRIYYYYRIVHPGNQPLMIANILSGIGAEIAIQNDLYYFVSFDYPTYVKEPFVNPTQDQGGRQYFWNSLLKSALFSSFGWKAPMLARILALSELAMALYLAVTTFSAVFLDRRRQAEWLPPLLFVGIEIAALMTYRALYPCSWCQDHRYIYATTAVLALLYAKSIVWYEEQHFLRMKWVGVGLGVEFICLSLAFALIQAFA
ncbi:MAG: hypothetical protein JO089_06855 [Alphaproteobacteria bacterium]|nr:hypothetical protein [Alphaproteobacteria bacterium]